jgi:hypothetical protein
MSRDEHVRAAMAVIRALPAIRLGLPKLDALGPSQRSGPVIEGDAVAYVNGVLKTKAAESDMLRAQAAVNTARKIYA